MLAYIKGILDTKAKGMVIVDVGGLGYKIFMSDTSIEKLGNIGEQVKIHTYYKVREDDISIYGFNTKEELRMFELMISVSGIGSKTALVVLSILTPEDFAIAVVSNDVKTITKVPGIGAKSAQRMILELKDKLKAEAIEGEIHENNKAIKKQQNNENVDEAITALQVLGYLRKDIEKALEKIDLTDLSLEDIIKKGLVMLSK